MSQEGWPTGFRVMVTGHRDVRGQRADVVRGTLERILTKMKERNPEGVVAISGMAIGTDIEFAEVALELGCPLVAAIPTENQQEPWPREARDRYQQALDRANMTVGVWLDPLYATTHIGARFHARNRWMIDHSTEGAAIAVWDGRQAGGTWAAVKEILRRGRKVLVIDPRTGDLRIEKPSESLRDQAKGTSFGTPYGVAIKKRLTAEGVEVEEGSALDLFADVYAHELASIGEAMNQAMMTTLLDTSDDPE